MKSLELKINKKKKKVSGNKKKKKVSGIDEV